MMSSYIRITRSKVAMVVVGFVALAGTATIWHYAGAQEELIRDVAGGRAVDAALAAAHADAQRTIFALFSVLAAASLALLMAARQAADLAAETAERKKAQSEPDEFESRLRCAQKLESLGMLAAGIAHEVNTPIQYIGDNTRFLKDGFADLMALLRSYSDQFAAACGGTFTEATADSMRRAVESVDLDYLVEEIGQAIDQTLDGVERVSEIVRAMREFSHPGSDEKKAVDLNDVIRSTITVARNEWKYVADVQTSFDDTLVDVVCLPGDIKQVILNLIVNAAHAIGDVVGSGDGAPKGEIAISTRRDGDWAEIRIADTGGGIPVSARAKIFEPFFTTKDIGKGTGQGLAIARAIVVEKHDGTIEFETEIGKGTAFIIRLPLQGAPVATVGADRGE